MIRQTTVSLHLYQGLTGLSSALPFNAAQKTAIETRLTSLFTSPQNIGNGDSFTCNFQFGNDLHGSGADKDDGELLDDLRSLGALSVPAGTWATRVLIAQSSTRSQPPLGVMFDTGGRQGCAVFVDAIRGFGLSHEKLLIRTIAHELGHVFNLAHEDALGQDVQILFDPARNSSINGPAISNDCWEHLLRHDLDSVRPGSGVAFGGRRCSGHPQASFDAAASGSSGRGAVNLQLRIAPGQAYPNPSRPTFVIGEPIYLTLTVTNGSRRAVLVPRAPGTATQEIVVLRLDPSGDRVNLSPPLLFCTPPVQRSWFRLEPGASADFRETLHFRNGELVFPREGRYRLVTALRLRGRWISSEPLTVRIVPPLEKRHERSSAMVAEPEVGLFIELGGSVQSGPMHKQLASLSRSNPKFPLTPLVRLLDGRRDVLAEAKTPVKSRERLEGLAANSALPRPVRAEAELLVLLDSAQKGDRKAGARLRRRLSNEAKLPVAPYTAHLIRRRLESSEPSSSQGDKS